MSKTYILLKDLPYLKAGAEFDFIHSTNPNYKSKDIENQCCYRYNESFMISKSDWFMEKSEYEFKKALGYFQDFEVTGIKSKTFKYNGKDCTEQDLFKLVQTGELKPSEYMALTFGLNSPKQEKPKTMDKKIIGYKAPIDYLSWGIKKGDLFIRAKAGQDYQRDGFAPTKLPSQIVETWEAVYKEEEKTLSIDVQRAVYAEAKSKMKDAKDLLIMAYKQAGIGVKPSPEKEFTKDDMEKAFIVGRTITVSPIPPHERRSTYNSFEDYYATLNK